MNRQISSFIKGLVDKKKLEIKSWTPRQRWEKLEQFQGLLVEARKANNSMNITYFSEIIDFLEELETTDVQN
tara:strand:+ start:112 stop:327 length:216 start_codon:yes stop_codon:yes gene_type:complete